MEFNRKSIKSDYWKRIQKFAKKTQDFFLHILPAFDELFHIKTFAAFAVKKQQLSNFKN